MASHSIDAKRHSLFLSFFPFLFSQQLASNKLARHAHSKVKKQHFNKTTKYKQKLTPFGINLLKSQELDQAAQEHLGIFTLFH